MSISCTYPDKKSEASVLMPSGVSEALSAFDLEAIYTNLLESEIQLFFIAIFGVDVMTTPLDDITDKGSIVTDNVDTISYNWDDIPVIRFVIYPNYEDLYGFTIQCIRLYDMDNAYAS